MMGKPSHFVQGIILMLAAIILFGWGIANTAALDRHQEGLLDAIHKDVGGQTEKVVENQRVIIAGTKLTVCLLEYRPEERSAKVFQRCRRQSGWDEINKADVLGTTITRTPRQTINRHRVNHGCKPLKKAGPELTQSARRWSAIMARHGYIYHSVLHAGPWSKVGEVVGVGPTWRSVVRALFKSKPHRRILLDCQYDYLALGVVYRDGFAWLTGRLYAK